MRTYDLSPLFQAETDPDNPSRSLENSVRPQEGGAGYPPYNIERLAPNLYRLVLAVAGFCDSDLGISVQCSTLVVTGKTKKEYDTVDYLYRGIAGRAFEKHFQLGDFIRVEKAVLENGLLMILLERELPEALKPKRIAIETRFSSERLLEQKSE